MSKAIYVMDEMPANCMECTITTCDNDLFMIGTEKRPMMCPLKEMPERAKIDEFWDDDSVGYVAGWNACLDEIGDKDAK